MENEQFEIFHKILAKNSFKYGKNLFAGIKRSSWILIPPRQTFGESLGLAGLHHCGAVFVLLYFLCGTRGQT